MSDFKVNPTKDHKIKMGTYPSEVHLVCEATEQPHLADDCDPDVEMQEPRTSESLTNYNKDQATEEREFRKHLNVTLSEASHLTKRAKAANQDINLESQKRLCVYRW